MNREGKSYRRATRASFTSIPAGVIVTVVISKRWNDSLGERSNFTHSCLVLEDPSGETTVGRIVSIDERMYFHGGKLVSSWDRDDLLEEI